MFSKQPAMIELPSGFKLARSMYVSLKMSIDCLSSSDPETFNELVKKCQYPEYKMTSDSERKATSLGLLMSGTVHAATREVILSVAEICEEGMSGPSV